jgi:hypothetical protein
MRQRFQAEGIKKAKRYGLETALENRQTKDKISIPEALCAISMLGGQGFFFCNCKGNCNKNNCKCKKMEGSATASVTLPTRTV